MTSLFYLHLTLSDGEEQQREGAPTEATLFYWPILVIIVLFTSTAVQLRCSGCYALGLGVRQLAHESHASRRLRRLDLDRRCAHSRVDRRFSNELGKSLPRHHHYRCRARSRVDHAALA